MEGSTHFHGNSQDGDGAEVIVDNEKVLDIHRCQVMLDILEAGGVDEYVAQNPSLNRGWMQILGMTPEPLGG